MTMFERFSSSARVSVVLAQEEARELNSDEVRPEHLLVGVLQSAGRDLSGVLSGYGLTAGAIRDRLASADRRDKESFDADAEALRAIGIDLRAVRAAVDRTFGAGTFDNALRKSGRRRRRRGHIPFTKPAKKVLELSLREALAHKDNWIGCEHIMLGILRGGDTFTMGLITERVDASQLRGAIVDLLDEAA
jgi:ATP-dependent Clp protease ATP-binding subunit ClpA